MPVREMPVPEMPLRAAALIREIPDFPKSGILFRDIAPLLADPNALEEVIAQMAAQAQEWGVDAVAGVESRGFLFGVPVALSLGIPFVPIRKAGKLPGETVQEEYALEYGTAILEVQRDAALPGRRVVIVDDLLATGGTIRAAASLVTALGGTVAGASFLIELAALGGRAVLGEMPIQALLTY